MMPQRNLGGAQFAGDAIQYAAAQARTERASGLAFGNQALDDGVGVLFLDVKGHTNFCEVLRQHIGRKSRLLLVEIDRHDVEMNWRVVAQVEQDIEQPKGILAPGEAHHHLVAFFNHVVVGDGLTNFAPQTLGQFVGFEYGFLGLAVGDGGVHGVFCWGGLQVFELMSL